MNNRVREEIDRRHSLEKERALRLGEWARGNKAGPFKMMYFPTNACNLECAICWQRQGVHDYSDLSVERQTNLIDEAIANYTDDDKLALVAKKAEDFLKKFPLYPEI